MSTPWREKIPGGLKRLLIWVILLTTWEAAYRVIQWRDYIFPAPSQVLDSTLGLLNISSDFGSPLHRGWPFAPSSSIPPGHSLAYRFLTSPLVAANLTSGVRLVEGFVISTLLGALLGAAMWRWLELDEFLGPVFLGLQTLPSVCWVPVAILVFGLNEKGILFVLVMGSAFGIAISMRDGLRTIPPLYQRAGLMLGASGWRMYRYVLLPASLPALASSLRQGFSFAWRSLMGAELILAANWHGLGFLLMTGQSNNDIAQVVAVMAMMVIIGILADRFVFAPLEKRVHTRFGLGAG